MDVQLTPDQKAFALREDRERVRSEVLGALTLAEASLARGDGQIITKQSMVYLASEVKQRGRAKLVAEQSANASCGSRVPHP